MCESTGSVEAWDAQRSKREWGDEGGERGKPEESKEDSGGSIVVENGADSKVEKEGVEGHGEGPEPGGSARKRFAMMRSGCYWVYDVRLLLNINSSA